MNAIGIDVGGTKIAAGWVAFPAGTVRVRRTIPTEPSRGGAAILDDVVRLAVALREEAQAAGTRIDTLGLGLCELVDPSGRIRSAHCVQWMDQPVHERLSAVAPFALEADVRAAARAEARFGAGRGLGLFLYLTVGTGIACCLVIDGEPFTGARGAAGTMASAPSSAVCGHCGRLTQSTLEQVAAGPALVERFNRRCAQGAANAQQVLAAAADGDADALEVVRTGGEALGSGLGQLINVLDPQVVVVGGGLGLSEGHYWNALVESTRRHIWSDAHRQIPILRAGTGADAGIVGAAWGSVKRLRSHAEARRRRGSFQGMA